MFEWFFGNRHKKLEEKAEKGFSSVRKDMDAVGKWLKHLDGHDKQLFELIKELKHEISSVKKDLNELREELKEGQTPGKHEQLFKKTAVSHKQTPVEDVYEAVQTDVQTGSFYDIFKNLSANERLILFTLMNSDMKLSYEDIALLLGKDRATIRGQINAIKQKSEGLIEEIIEKNGKKRVFVPEEVRVKLGKYAKVRVKKKKKEAEEQAVEEKGEEHG